MPAYSQIKGNCLCGAITVSVVPDAETVDACHCSNCRRWSGGPYLAVQCGSNIEIEGGDKLGVYRSSEWAERTFCRDCGSMITWRLHDGTSNHVAAYLFAEAEAYPLAAEVFIDQKPAGYSFAEDTNKMTAADVFAMFAPKEENGHG